jgi:hypothetical protein
MFKISALYKAQKLNYGGGTLVEESTHYPKDKSREHRVRKWQKNCK